MSSYSPWEIEVRHDGLNKYRMIRGSDRHVVQARAAALEAQWDDEWARRCEVEERRQNRINDFNYKERQKEVAAARTADAVQNIQAMSWILKDGLRLTGGFDWDHLKDFSKFPEPAPTKPPVLEYPPAPVETSKIYKPKIGFLEFLFPARKRAAISRAHAHLERDRSAWDICIAEIAEKNAAASRGYDALVSQWSEREREFLLFQNAVNSSVDARAASAVAGAEEGMNELLDLALSRQIYPDWLNVNYEIDYASEVKTCVIDFDLPAPARLPSLKDVKYIVARDEFTEKHIGEAERARLYDSVLYQVALRTLWAVFDTDRWDHLQRATFNGWVNYVDRASGIDERACVMTVAANRADLAKIDLERVDPKECFRALKGVAASKLIGLAAVAPLERPRGVDRRLIESREVAANLDMGVNIAAMDWKDFEHLVRQVFEHEFASNQSEVRVTQASRDGGVDAIVFDPDPIKGGKIVIQAKRYTNTVDVSSVRDLYGTVMNEGATKGILVTTSNFGPDARKFAQGKPLTLLDGGNFLYLLEKMGVQARIDLKEAKELLRAE